MMVSHSVMRAASGVSISRKVSAVPTSTKPSAVSGSMRPGTHAAARACSTTMNTPPTSTAIAHSIAGTRGLDHSAAPARTNASPVLSCMMKWPASISLRRGSSSAQAMNTSTPTPLTITPSARDADRKRELSLRST